MTLKTDSAIIFGGLGADVRLRVGPVSAAVGRVDRGLSVCRKTDDQTINRAIFPLLDMISTKEELAAILSPHGQEQLLTFWDELSAEQKDALAAEVRALDIPEIERLYRHRNDPAEAAALADRATEPNTFHLSDLRERADRPDYPGKALDPYQAIAVGEEALRAGKLAAAVVAGGQGTRLDFLHAKGIYPIGPISGVTLFQIHVERIRAMAEKYHTRIPFCIQTSPATHEETIAFFKENDNFGLADEDVLVFCQGAVASVRFEDCQILLSQKWEIAKSPDGHGGFLAAINEPQTDSPFPNVRQHGILTELQRRGIEELFYFQIDNPVIDICNPEFIGYHLMAGSEYSSQVVRKTAPNDRVGNMVMVDGRLHVIEYSDIPDAAAKRRKPDGSLAIWAGSIAVHLMNVAFLKAKADFAGSLPYHTAKKKVPYIVVDPEARDANGVSLFGTKVKPDTPNAIKFEKFIFDLLPQAKNPIVVEIDEQTGFAPLKNHPREAKDNPQTVRKRLLDLYRRWLRNLGYQVADDVDIEISPLYANSATELKERLEREGKSPADGPITHSEYWS